MNFSASLFCAEVVLIDLYPNATRILQPADVSAFRAPKNAWKEIILEWRRDHPWRLSPRTILYLFLKRLWRLVSKVQMDSRLQAHVPGTLKALTTKCVGNRNKQHDE